MKKTPLIIKMMIPIILGLSLSCQKTEVEDVSSAIPSKTLHYVYKDQIFVEQYKLDGSKQVIIENADKAKIDAILDKKNIAMLTSNSEPNKIYVFDSFAECEKFQESWSVLAVIKANRAIGINTNLSSRTASTYDYPEFDFGMDFLPQGNFVYFYSLAGFDPRTYAVAGSNTGTDFTPSYGGPDFNHSNGLWTLEWSNLANYIRPDQTNLGPFDTPISVEDQISSLEGGYNPTNYTSPFKVVVWQGRDFSENSWTIVVDANHPHFYDGNIHDNRMNSSHSWGDQISSIYVLYL